MWPLPLTGGIERLVTLLSTKDNVKFLAVCADCLQLLAFKDQDSKVGREGPACVLKGGLLLPIA